ncbi:MAG: methylmalonyl Co-A mutase-associated GTPase MeaB [Anaerolineae bacterium]|nr:methylmalonyl Co-A mutase-associated GTPase MeaB [Anaerolineae bacterium]
MNDWLDLLGAGPDKPAGRRALARLITHIENDTAEGSSALAALYPYTGRAYRIGVTGAGGAGKSTLVTALTCALRARGQTVGIIAVDPTSPFSGGALLGDRVRMHKLAGDPGVFIRSMASRGARGGLARATADVALAMDAAGFDILIIETVGAGQSEVEIARTAHTAVVVEAPGMGDAVQALKAGLLEIADVLVVNKADRPGVRATVNALQTMFESMPHPPPGAPPVWFPPVIETVATKDDGIEALLDAIDAHCVYLNESNKRAEHERARVEADIMRRLRDGLLGAALDCIGAAGWEAAVAQVAARQTDPQTAAGALIAALGLGEAKAR